MDTDSTGVLDLSKTPPVSVGEPPKCVSEVPFPNAEHRAATYSETERLSINSLSLPDSAHDSTSNPHHAAQESPTSRRKEQVGSSSGGSGSEGSRTPRRGSSSSGGPTTGAAEKDSNTADKHCDKLFNPAVFESDEDELPVGKRLTRNQARLASLRRREQEREAAAAEAPPAKQAKMDFVTTASTSTTTTTTTTSTTPATSAEDAASTDHHTTHKECATPEKSSKNDDVANNNNVDASADEDSVEGVDRACPYCGVSCAKPSDMKRHLLVHMETKPFVCKVGCVDIAGGG